MRQNENQLRELARGKKGFWACGQPIAALCNYSPANGRSRIHAIIKLMLSYRGILEGEDFFDVCVTGEQMRA